jgi:hypothetical protein
MITDTCTWHTRLDTHAHTRYLYEHELGYSMEYAIGNTPSVHAAEPGRAPTCTEPPRIYTAAAHRKYLPSHRYCTYFARNPHREYRRSKVLDIISNYLDLDNRKVPIRTESTTLVPLNPMPYFIRSIRKFIQNTSGYHRDDRGAADAQLASTSHGEPTGAEARWV